MENSYKIWMAQMGAQVFDPGRIIMIKPIEFPPPSIHYAKWRILRNKKVRRLRFWRKLWIWPAVVLTLAAGIAIGGLCGYLTGIHVFALWIGMISGACAFVLYDYLAEKWLRNI